MNIYAGKETNYILEHSLISGSEKYPAADILFDMAYNTYVSYVNAHTDLNGTFYPILSASEKQLMKSTDVYLDSDSYLLPGIRSNGSAYSMNYLMR